MAVDLDKEFETSQTWLVEPMPIHGRRIVDLEGREVVRDIYDPDIAALIVSEHNQHAKLAATLRAAQTWLAGLAMVQPVNGLETLLASIDAALNPKG